MSQSNISETDPIQINNLGEEENSSSRLEINFDFKIVTNPNDFNEFYDSNDNNGSDESPWSTQGYLLGARTIYPPPEPVNSPIIPVLPRRRNSGMGGEERPYHQLFRGLQNTEDDQESLDREDLWDGDDFDEEPRESRSAVVIGRNHPASSQAAIAGYRYRTR